VRSSWVPVLYVSALLFAGCSGMPVAPTNQISDSNSSPTITGRVHGGQNPISGARVYLLTAVNYSATSTYGGPGIAPSSTNASASVLTSGDGSDSLGYYVTTGSNGSFTISGDYTCGSPSHYYIYALGGDSGSGTNSAAGLLASLGSCSDPNFASTYVVVNEVSTVATAYSFAGFTSDATHMSAPNHALAGQGAKNASVTVGNLETLSTGQALATTPAGNGTVPQAEINTLANILAACINSTGPGSSQCTTLFSNAMNGSTAPTDTATAAINIAHNPGLNVANLFALQGSSPPFVPDLSFAPSDFTISINYSVGTGLGPFFVAIDGAGNVWATTLAGSAVGELNPEGAVLSGTTGYSGGGQLNGAFGLAIDASGNVWLANNNSNTITELSSAGSSSFTSPAGSGGLDAPYQLAIDKSGNIWVTNNINGAMGVSEFSSSGSPNVNSPFNGGGLNNARGIAIDASGNLWMANHAAATISEFGPTGSPNLSSPFGGGGLSNPFTIAIDGAGNVWAADDQTNDVSELSSSGAANNNSPFSSGGIASPAGIAIDGAGNVWVADRSTAAISEISSSGTAISGSTGYTSAGLQEGYGIAVDGAGNVWVADPAGQDLTEFVGAATPVVTPIVANLLSPYGSSAVNKP
jgi:streptogramin lyase